MRTVYLCRHAKSDWANALLNDHDRPLNARGERNAPFMARLFAERGEPIDRILSSTAVRARTTAYQYADALGIAHADVTLVPELYHPSVETIQRVINALPNSIGRVMLFGHNPGFSLAVEHFADSDMGVMPTAGIARIDMLVNDWQAVARGTGTVVWQDMPKRYPGQS
jgi:phosphohistidine phosphatase